MAPRSGFVQPLAQAERQRQASRHTLRAHGREALRQCRILQLIRTVAETGIFKRYASEVWTEAEREEFVTWIAANPEAGAIITGSGGCRKVRWATAGQGKRGGARVIYFLHTDDVVWLLIVYKKAKFDNLPTSFVAQLRKAVQDAL